MTDLPWQVPRLSAFQGIHVGGGQSMSEPLKAPFPYFGGKSAIAELVWSRLGLVDNYIEGFFGSGAVLLLRPQPLRGVETLNDADSYVANFWRATQHDPEAVASFADGPVNEVDLHSRHRYLVLSDDALAFRERMRTDPDYFDAKVAGWWCWGLCCWIGSGWCTTPRELERHQNASPDLTGPCAPGSGQGVHNTDPKSKLRLGGDNPGSVGKGVHAGGELSQQVPDPRSGRTSRGGRGVRAVGDTLPDGNRPQLADAYDIGRGVCASPPSEFSQQVPLLSANQSGFTGQGVTMERPEIGTCAARRAWLLDWFSRLRDRLRNVRVCCGDWSRVCSSESTTTRLGVTAVFLDPPYPKKRKCGKASRAGNLYSTDGEGHKTPEQIRDEVLAYCLERGPDPMMRLAVCGYDTDGYSVLAEEHGWSEVAWKAGGGYGNRSEEGKKNAGRERVWFSKFCHHERTLFDSLPEE